MAVYIPIRPRWNPRGVVVNYVCRSQLCVRSWPKGYRDAKTAAQCRQRGRMAQVCAALPHVKELLTVGYAAVTKRNGRRVGGYHAAVSTALREWFVSTPQGDRLDCARLQLTDGVHALPEGMRMERRSGKLIVSWSTALPWNAPRLLLAAREAKTNQWIAVPVVVGKGSRGVGVRLPKAWRGKGIEVWVAYVGDAQRVKTKTLHATLRARTTPAPTPFPTPPSQGGQSVRSRPCPAQGKRRDKG